MTKNGSRAVEAAKLANGARRMPIRKVTVDLTGDFDGWNFTARVGLKMGEYLSLMEYVDKEPTVRESLIEMKTILTRQLVSWNFVDENGDELPADADGIDALPLDLLSSCFTSLMGVIGKAPLASVAK